MVRFRFKDILFPLIVLVVMSGCVKRGPSCPGGPGCEPTENSHTFLMYMVADNNLSYYLSGNVNMAKSAVAKGLPADSRVLVYWDGSSSTKLSELKVDEKGMAVEQVLKTYDKPSYPASPDIMKQVLEDVKYFAPAEVYGIVLSSHASGWFPPELSFIDKPKSDGSGAEHNLWKPDGALTRSFGANWYSQIYMSIPDLVEGLSAIHFDYIISDACFMSSIEAVYDMRNSADYILASPVEVMGDGIPFLKVLPVLFNRQFTMEQRLATVAATVVKYYMEDTYPSSAMTLIKADRIDALADAAKEVYAAGLADIDISGVQYLELVSPDHAFFDFRDYISQSTASGDAATKAAFANFNNALSKAIIYENHTPSIYSAYGASYLKADRFCGISTYIPRDKFPITRQAYYDTAWAKYTQP